MGRKIISNWNSNIIKSELSAIISVVGHFPTQSELIVLKRHDLLNAIGRNGGLSSFCLDMGFCLRRKSAGYWNDETILNELRILIDNIGHFPVQRELHQLKMSSLLTAMLRNGGTDKYKQKLGYTLYKNHRGYWSEEKIYNELEQLIKKLGHFPSYNEVLLNKKCLISAIGVSGGFTKYRKLLNCSLPKNQNGYWTKENIKKELLVYINKYGDFPTSGDLRKRGHTKLLSAISESHGINWFCTEMGYVIKKNSTNYWSKKLVYSELEKIIIDIGHFPKSEELKLMGKGGMISAILKNGGFSKISVDMGYEPYKHPTSYWNDKEAVFELNKIILKIGRFPSLTEIMLFGCKGLISYIYHSGGLIKYMALCGVDIEKHKEYISLVISYLNRRGKKSESIIYHILKDYCISKEISLPTKNVKLSKGNVIEFVCNTNKKIGIDVTNTRTRSSVYYKYTRKDYYKYLDELWIVVVSDSFTEEDYIKWNKESPDNVYVYSIDDFIEELQYDLDEHTKNKIEKYKKCTFHTRKNLKEQSLNNESISSSFAI